MLNRILHPGISVLEWFAAALLSVTLTTLSSRAAEKFAYPVELAWSVSPDSDISGHAVYYVLEGSSLTNRIDAGMSGSVKIPNLQAYTNYFFYVVSYDANGIEGPPSDIIKYAPPALSPVQLKLLRDGSARIHFQAATGALCHVEFSPSLSPPQWHWLAAGTADTNGNVIIKDPLGRAQSRFYRAVEP